MNDKATLVGITIAVLVVVGLVLGLSPMFNPVELDEPIIPVVNGQTEEEKDVFVNSCTVIIYSEAPRTLAIGSNWIDSGYGLVWNTYLGNYRYNWDLRSWSGGFVLYAWK